MGTSGPVVLMIYSGGTTAEALDMLDLRQTELLKSHAKLFTLSLIVGEGHSVPSADLRHQAAKLQEKYGPKSTGAAIVFLVSGLAAVVARGFMAAYSLVAPTQFAQKTFRSVADAVQWARGLPGQLPELAAPDLTSAIEQFLAEDQPPRE